MRWGGADNWHVFLRRGNGGKNGQDKYRDERFAVHRTRHANVRLVVPSNLIRSKIAPDDATHPGWRRVAQGQKRPRLEIAKTANRGDDAPEITRPLRLEGMGRRAAHDVG